MYLLNSYLPLQTTKPDVVVEPPTEEKELTKKDRVLQVRNIMSGRVIGWSGESVVLFMRSIFSFRELILFHDGRNHDHFGTCLTKLASNSSFWVVLCQLAINYKNGLADIQKHEYKPAWSG